MSDRDEGRFTPGALVFIRARIVCHASGARPPLDGDAWHVQPVGRHGGDIEECGGCWVPPGAMLTAAEARAAVAGRGRR